MENKTKDYDQYCKALNRLENAADIEMKRKETNYGTYLQFYKKTDEIIRKFTQKTEMKSLNITNLLFHHRNELTQRIVKHVNNNGGFVAA